MKYPIQTTTSTQEINPFTSLEGAREWINCVEKETNTIREKEITPLLSAWQRQYMFKRVLDLGCGQGVHADLFNGDCDYVGVDPSLPLVTYAHIKYGADNKTFTEGSAYDIPLASDSFEGCFSVNVWFHLKDIQKASKELSRVLMKGGRFMIVTANPYAYDVWQEFYENKVVDEGETYMVGTVKVLLNPNDHKHEYAKMKQNTFFFHQLDEIAQAFADAGLQLEKSNEFGLLPISKDKNLFVALEGSKQ